jgi:hypothetical protein
MILFEMPLIPDRDNPQMFHKGEAIRSEARDFDEWLHLAEGTNPREVELGGPEVNDYYGSQPGSPCRIFEYGVGDGVVRYMLVFEISPKLAGRDR